MPSNGDLPVAAVIDPSEQVVHDVMDCFSISPHTRKDPFRALQRRADGDDDVAAELKLTADFLHDIGSRRTRTWVVESNHDRHFLRWLRETDWKSDLKNVPTFLKVNLAQVEAMNRGDAHFDAFEHAIRLSNPSAQFTMARKDKPLKFFRHYYHLHGDEGANGSTGSDASSNA